MRSAWWHSHFVFFITLIASLHSFSSCPLHHRQSLLLFKTRVSTYYTANSSSFTRLSSWNSSSIDCCTWERVYCSLRSALKPVTELHLSSAIAREGTYISSEALIPLFHIESLIFLDVSYNFLQGRIPGDELSNLTNLAYLDMFYNLRINGSIPFQIFGMKNLYHLNLGYNLLTGNLSENIGNLSKLTYLNLVFNHLSGSIPSEIGKLAELQVLYLSHNNLDGGIPQSILQLGELAELFLGQNYLSGRIPYFRKAEADKLEYLYLDGNNLSGEIPLWLFDLRNLKGLNLSQNNLLWNNTDRKSVV